MNLHPSTDRDLWISWDQYHSLIERLALSIHESGWEFEKIICLARGGMRVGDVLSRIFDVPLGILATSSYREAAGTQQGSLDIAQFITITRGTLDGKVLLVDDMVDTGKRMLPLQVAMLLAPAAVAHWLAERPEPDTVINRRPMPLELDRFPINHNLRGNTDG